MISLTCTSCKRGLEIDDAFAGGVCRCQFCGTIQTVPAGLKKGGRPATPVGTAAATQKTLYQKQTSPKSATTTGVEPEMPPTAVGTRAARAAQPPPPAPPPTWIPGIRNTWVIGIALGVAAAVVIGVIAWVAL